MEDAPEECRDWLEKYLLKLKTYVVRALILYLLYVSVSATLPFVIPNPNAGTLSADGYAQGKRYHDRVALIETGEEGARIRLGLIEDAHKSIDISYYTFIGGRYSEIFLPCLLDAADRGVHVRFLFDGLTRHAYEHKELKDTIRAFETHPNIEVRYYEKPNPLTPWAWHTRLHEKSIIVDGKLALIGGRNIGDKYFYRDEYQNRYVNDRDTLIYHEGSEASVIGDMQRYFDQIWEYKHTKPHRKKIRAGQREKGALTNTRLRSHYHMVKDVYPELFKKPDWVERTHPAESIQFVHNPLGRLNKDPWCLKTLLELSSQAQSSVFLQSPYLLFSRQMRKDISHYEVDWNKVDVLTNSKRSSPNPIAMAAYFTDRKEIADTVASLYEYQGPDSIHGKSYVFDDSISVIGTLNLDARSAYINTESMIIITSGRFASDLTEEIQEQLGNSVLVGDDHTYGGKAEDKKPLWLFSKFVGLFKYLL